MFVRNLLHVFFAKIGLSSCHLILPKKPQVLRIKKTDVEYNYKNTNNLLFFNYNGQKYVFREIKKHCCRKEYIRCSYKDFSFFSGINFTSFDIEDILNNPLKFARFWNMGTKDDPNSRVSKFFYEKDNHIIGIDSVSDDEREKLELFINYIWSEIYIYRMTPLFDRWQTSSAAKIIAQRKCADIFRASHLYCDCGIVRLIIEDYVKTGILQPFANGTKTNRLSDNTLKKMYTPSVHRDLLKLNILDYINFEKDHRPGNYMIVRNGEESSLVAFDNDSPMCFFPYPLSTFHSYKNSSSLIVKGRFNRPFIEDSFKDRIMSISYKEVHSVLKDYLNIVQLWALWKRIVNIRQALKHTDDSTLETLSDGCWNSSLYDRELSGKYGRTYLSIFLTQQEPSLQL